MANASVVAEVDKRPDRQVRLEPFRHPHIPGTDLDPVCGHPFSKHGWIDPYFNNGFGLTVCPY